METKHTPGPWIGSAPIATISDVVIEARDEAGNRLQVAQACSHPERAVRDANARLIAAAPEMLEALRQCEEALSNDRTFNGGPLHAQARAAIAKATGEGTR